MARRRLLKSDFYIIFNESPYGQALEIDFWMEGGENTFSVVSDSEWVASGTLPSWCTISQTAGTRGVTEIEVTCDENTGTASKSASITLETTDGKHSIVLTIKSTLKYEVLAFGEPDSESHYLPLNSTDVPFSGSLSFSVYVLEYDGGSEPAHVKYAVTPTFVSSNPSAIVIPDSQASARRAENKNAGTTDLTSTITAKAWSSDSGKEVELVANIVLTAKGSAS